MADRRAIVYAFRKGDNIINIIKAFGRGLIAGFSVFKLFMNANCFHIVVCICFERAALEKAHKQYVLFILQWLDRNRVFNPLVELEIDREDTADVPKRKQHVKSHNIGY